MDPSFDDRLAVNAANAKRRDTLLTWMQTLLAERPDLIAKSTPDYPAMGKRVLQDDGSWFRCLAKANVELVRTPIERILPEGVVTVDGQMYEAGIICYATGFRHNEFLAPMELVGRRGVSLREQWGEQPTAYLGITMPNFPNLFCAYGPGTNLAHGASLFFHSEFQVRYAMDAIHRVLTSGARAIEVRKDVHDDYVRRYTDEINQLVWAHPSITHSHYKNPQGKVFTLSPWPLEQYREWTRAIDADDYVLS
jgi:4-hydroxyacetophenone monooxygenase